MTQCIYHDYKVAFLVSFWASSSCARHPCLQGLFILRGASATAAYSAALQEISGLVRRQATVLAMQDAFRLSVVLTGLAIMHPSLCAIVQAERQQQKRSSTHPRSMKQHRHVRKQLSRYNKITHACRHEKTLFSHAHKHF